MRAGGWYTTTANAIFGRGLCRSLETRSSQTCSLLHHPIPTAGPAQAWDGVFISQRVGYLPIWRRPPLVWGRPLAPKPSVMVAGLGCAMDN